MRNLRFFLLLVAIATVNAVTAQSEIMSYEKLDDKTGVASLNGMGGLAVYSELDNLSINITNAKDERVTKGLVGNGMYEYKVTINPNETLNGKVEVNWGVERLTFLAPIRANFLTAYSVEKVKHPIRLVDRTSDTDVYFDAARAQVEITSAVADLKVNVSPNLRADIQTGVKDKTTGITTTTITFPIKTLTDARGKLDDAERAYEAVDIRLKQAEGKQLSQHQREQLVNEHRNAENRMYAARDALAALTHISVYGNGSNVLDIDISSARARSKFCWGVESRESVSPSKQSSGSSRKTLTSQYVLFNLSPDNAVVELDGQMLETADGTATKRMPFGTYSYRVQAPKHAPKTGSLTVSNPKTKYVVKVTLEPQFGNFTFTVADNAEIWIDEQLRGTGSCTVELGYGTYLVECRKDGYRPTSQEVVVGKDNAKEKITLNPPTPIYGSIDINSAPANAEVWIDGKQVGTTPMFLSECLAGSHEVKLKKQGYKVVDMTTEVEEGQTAVIHQALENAFSSDGKTFTVKGVTFKMIRVEAGTFQMGSTSSDGIIDKPVHSVTISKDYYIGETEVTQELWTTVMGTNPSNFTSGSQLPVEQVSWDDCQTFIAKLNSLTGATFRLPTEAEWEFAARGGNKSQGYTYSGSNTIDNVAWYSGNSSSNTHVVKTKSHNELGIYDMSGNVWEWCQDWYGSYSSAPVTDPTGASSGSNRVFRGDGWRYEGTIINCTTRNATFPSNTFSDLGLRLAMTAKEKEIQTANTRPALKEKTETAIAVDLGLPSGTLWADRNVGADSPEDYGDYFAWGETEPKSTYDLSSYKWCKGSATSITKYSCEKSNGYNGSTDGKTILEWSDDVATANMGSNWHMPSIAQLKELESICKWTWTTQNGVNGYKVTGPNDNSIFLPAVGSRDDSGIHTADTPGSEGKYWTNTLSNGFSNNAYCIWFNSEFIFTNYSPLRFAGLAVRAVKREKTVKNKVIAVDLGLPSGALWADRNVGADSPEQYGDLFAWGETKPKSTYDWSTYKWMDSSGFFTKYCKDIDSTSGHNEFTDGKTYIEASDDAATQNMGSYWRMPTHDEFIELKHRCTWTWSTQNNVKGYKITGPNGKSIFLPAKKFDGTDAGAAYWSSCLSVGLFANRNAIYFHLDSHNRNLYHGVRYSGIAVRAVLSTDSELGPVRYSQ